MKKPIWVERRALELLHGVSLARFGGAPGLRDEAMLESALARPKNAFHYGETPDVTALAASYAFGLVKDHPFVDGNKRVALLACGLFLELNGRRLSATPLDAYAAIMALASSQLGEEEFAQWLRLNSAKA